MKPKLLITTLLIGTTVFSSASCSAHDKSVTEQTQTAPVNSPGDKIKSNAQPDSASLQKALLVKTYTQAIADYLKAVQLKDKLTFDTLYLGKNVQFPDIQLPENLNGSHILLLNQESANSNQALYKKNCPFINIIGWVDNESAQFIFVTFYPEFNHQFDYFINYKFNSESKAFELDSIEFENYAGIKDAKPKRTSVFNNGKYVTD